MTSSISTVLINKARRSKRTLSLKAGLVRATVNPRAEVCYPDFLGIGAPRAATTWLYKRLLQHPEVYLPKMKELHFFDEKRQATYQDESGVNWFRNFYFDIDNKAHWRWYGAQFVAGKGLLKGDITPDYSTLSDSRVQSIKGLLPNLKIIYMLRNPVERAWSGVRRTLWHEVGKKPNDLGSMKSILKTAMHPEVLIRGDYQHAIKVWESAFGEAQILYLFFDDIAKDQRSQLIRVCEFLDVDPALLPSAQSDKDRVNEAPAQDMPDDIRAALTDYYMPQIQFLQEKFDRNLSHWITHNA